MALAKDKRSKSSRVPARGPLVAERLFRLEGKKLKLQLFAPRKWTNDVTFYPEFVCTYRFIGHPGIESGFSAHPGSVRSLYSALWAIRGKLRDQPSLQRDFGDGELGPLGDAGIPSSLISSDHHGSRFSAALCATYHRYISDYDRKQRPRTTDLRLDLSAPLPAHKSSRRMIAQQHFELDGKLVKALLYAPRKKRHPVLQCDHYCEYRFTGTKKLRSGVAYGVDSFQALTNALFLLAREVEKVPALQYRDDEGRVWGPGHHDLPLILVGSDNYGGEFSRKMTDHFYKYVFAKADRESRERKRRRAKRKGEKSKLGK